MTTRARKNSIIVASNTLGGKEVDLISRTDGSAIIYDETLNKYIHVQVVTEESDPIFVAWLNTNPLSGFLTSETDPIFTASPSYGITSQNITNWNLAYSWGNHAGLYEPVITEGTINQYWRGDKTWQDLTTSAVTEGTNLYFTNSRARSAISLTTIGTNGAATYSNSTGVLNIPQYDGMPDPMTTRGDIIFRNASNITSRLGRGTAGQMLTSDGTDIAWQTYTGSSNIVTVGTITSGTWSGSTIGVNRGGTGATSLTGILVGNGTSAFTTASSNTANQLLRRNSANTGYEFFTPTYLTSNQSISINGDASGSGTTSISLTVTGLRNASLPSLSAGFLRYTGSAWEFRNETYALSSHTLGSHSNVSIDADSDLIEGQLLRWNGSIWTKWTPNYITGNQTVTLSGDVTGSGTTNITTTYNTIVPVNKGGTNSSVTLNNNRVMISSGGSIVETSAITPSRALVSNVNGIPTHSTVTSTELGYLSGVTSSIQTQIGQKQDTISAGIGLSFSANVLNTDFEEFNLQSTLPSSSSFLIPFWHSIQNIYFTVSSKNLFNQNVFNANKLQGVSISTTTPTSGQFLSYSGSEWIPATITNPWTTDTYGISYLLGNVGIGTSSDNVNRLNITSRSAIRMLNLTNTDSSSTGLRIRAGSDSNNALEILPAVGGSNTITITGSGVISNINFTSNPTISSGYGSFYTLNGVPYFRYGTGTPINLASGGTSWLEGTNSIYSTTRVGVGGDVGAIATNFLSTSNSSGYSGYFYNSNASGDGVYISAGSSTRDALSVNDYLGNQRFSVKSNGKIYADSLTNASKANVLYYDTSTKEITYASSEGSFPKALIKNSSEGSDITLNYPHALIEVGDHLFASERGGGGTPVSTTTKVIKYNKDCSVAGYVNVTGGVETLCYNETNGLIYGVRYADSNLAIFSLNPSTLAYTEQTINLNGFTLNPGLSPAIVSHGSYIYGVSYLVSPTIFKLQIINASNLTVTSVVPWTATPSPQRGHAAKINPRTNMMYISCIEVSSGSTANVFAKVSLTDLSHTSVNISTYVNKATDDFAMIDDGSEVWCYVGGENVWYTPSYGGVQIKTSDMSLTGISLKPTYCLFSKGNIVLNATVDGHIQAFSRFNLEEVATYKLSSGYVANEGVVSSEGRIFVTTWQSASKVMELDLGTVIMKELSTSTITLGGSNQNIQYNNNGTLGGFGAWTGTQLTMPTGTKLSTAASTSTRAGLTLPHGTAPTSPVNGDIWTTSSGLFARINSSTIQMLVDPMTTRGDIIYRNSSNVTTRLGRGTVNQVLTSDGTDISWQTPASSLFSTGTYSIRTNTSSQNRILVTSIGTAEPADITNYALYLNATNGIKVNLTNNSTPGLYINSTGGSTSNPLLVIQEGSNEVFSVNPVGAIRLRETSSGNIGTPAATNGFLFMDSADDRLKWKTSTATYDLTATGSGGGSGTVTSVGLSLPNIFSISDSPVTTAGTLTGTFISQTAKTFFAAPNATNGTPTFRTILASDLGTGTADSGKFLRGDMVWAETSGFLEIVVENEYQLVSAWTTAISSTLPVRIYLQANQIISSVARPITFSTNRSFANSTGRLIEFIGTSSKYVVGSGSNYAAAHLNFQSFIAAFMNVTFRNVSFYSTGTGYIRALGSGNLTLENCTFTNQPITTSPIRYNVIFSNDEGFNVAVSNNTCGINIRGNACFNENPSNNNEAVDLQNTVYLHPFTIWNKTAYVGSGGNFYVDINATRAILSFSRSASVRLLSSVSANGGTPFKVSGDDSWHYDSTQQDIGTNNIRSTSILGKNRVNTVSGTTIYSSYQSGNSTVLTLTGNTTLNMYDITDGATGTILVRQGSTGRLLTLNFYAKRWNVSALTQIVVGPINSINSFPNSYTMITYKRFGSNVVIAFDRQTT